jgi:hypothetical protein
LLTLLGVSLVVAGLGAMYVTAFRKIRDSAYADYDHLLETGSFPRWTEGESPVAVTDGGSIFFEATGYRIWQMKQFDGPFDGECQRYIVGPRLEFTCQRWFPLHQGELRDRESLRIVDCD